MKLNFSRLISGITAVLCAGAGTYLAVHGGPHWGWFLFAAFLLAVCD